MRPVKCDCGTVTRAVVRYCPGCGLALFDCTAADGQIECRRRGAEVAARLAVLAGPTPDSTREVTVRADEGYGQVDALAIALRDGNGRLLQLPWAEVVSATAADREWVAARPGQDDGGLG